jgi:hypothetical protein
MSTRSLAWGAALGCLATGCSFGSFQTAHTQLPGTVSITPGVTYVTNRIADEAGRSTLTNSGAQLSGRAGITERIDVGVGSFLQTGLKGDVKMNVLSPHARLALAPRLGAGYRLGREIAMVEAGAITSYRLVQGLEPYVGLSFANHWIEAEAPAATPNAVAARGTGDGLLQLSIGIELVQMSHFAILVEYGHWFPLHDDPGDFYRFLPTNIFGIALRLGRVRRAESGGPRDRAAVRELRSAEQR